MNFGKIYKFLAQNLLAACFALGGFIALPSLPNQSLYADEIPSEAVVIPETPLLNPVVVNYDGLVLEIVYTEEELSSSEFPCESNLAYGSARTSLEEMSLPDWNVGEIEVRNKANLEPITHGMVAMSSLPSQRELTKGMGKGNDSLVKSVAVPGLFGFLGICPNRSDLPSRSFSMPCESSQSKSMTMRSANDWKFLWQPARMIFRLRQSTSSYSILKTLTRSSSLSHIRNTSDISSTWSNEMVGSQRIFPLASNLAQASRMKQWENRNRRESLHQNLNPKLPIQAQKLA